MFDIGWSEMAIVLLVALIVIGPKDLPRLARNMGQWAAKGRAMAREFQRALEDMAREAELDKVKSEIEKAGRTDLGKTIEKTIDPSGELSRALEPPVLGGTPAAPAPQAAATAMPAPATAAPQTTATAPTAPAPGTPAETERSPATGAPPQPAATAVTSAAPATSATGAPASNGAAAPATPRKRARRAPKASSGPEPVAPAANGTGAADDLPEPGRPTAPTESS